MLKLSNFKFVLLPCIIAIILGTLAVLALRDSTPPVISITPAIEHPISPNSKITVTATDSESPIKDLSIIVIRGDRSIPVLDKVYTEKNKEVNFEFSLASTGLKDGDVEIVITSTDRSFGGFGTGNKAKLIKKVKIDNIPLKVEVKTSVPYVRKGGSGVILFTANKEISKAGINVDNYFFPAFKQDNNGYICFFAFPYNLTPSEYKPTLFVQDVSGNTYEKPVQLNRLNQNFKHDSLNISQSFLDAKSDEFKAIFPGEMTDIERFKKINGPVRAACVAELLRIGQDSTPKIEWKGVFLRLPKSASRAGFADHRTYLWNGEKIDEQTHLGFDLASVVNAPVLASNNGRVIYSAYLGIYGNLIIIDHGAGVQSLYSHLSKSLVDVGQVVKKGETIAYTGKTGMAGGDHLHFGMLISGVEVTPLEWFDPKWIRDNLTSRLHDAGLDSN